VSDTALTVVVVDDHGLYRAGLVSLLRESGVTVLAEAASGPEGVETTVRERPDVVLMDVNLPGFDGIEAVRRLAEAAPEVQAVVLTVLADESTVVEALRAGAAGYLLKETSVDDMLPGLRAVAAGESLLSPSVARKLVHRLRAEHPSPADPALEMTERERQVLALLADGRNNREIAEALFISQNTVKSHVSNLLEKLGVGNRVQAVVRAYRDGLLRADE
jgi:DNA-binding NarL/FixJ family response regulator